MADDSVILNPGTGGAAIAVDTIAGLSHELVKIEFGEDGSATQVSATNPLPVTISQDIEIGAVELKNGTDDTRATVTAANALKVDNSAVTQPISAASLPLPSGAATSARQDTGNTSLSSIDGKITAVNTGAVVVSSSVLPSGAATGTKQDTGNTSVASIDTKTPALGQALAAASVPVVLTAAQITTLTPVAAITGYNLEATQLLVKAKTDNLDVALSTRLKAADTLAGITTVAAVTAITNALPAGNNNIGDVDVASIAAGDNNIGNVDVVTLPALVAGSAIIGKVGIDQTTPGTTNKVSLGSDVVHTIVDSGTLTSVTAITNALPAGANAIGKLAANDGIDIGDVTINNATGASAVNIQDGGNSITVDYATTGSGTATGALRVELPTNGTGVVGLNAGSNLVGKVGIDQTTPGTTNLVALTAETTKVIGVVRNADGSGNLITSTGNALDVNIKTPATLPVSIADGINVVEGALADAIVAAGATGSISAKLRRVTQGLEDLKTTIVLAAGTALIGKVGIDQTTPGTTNAVVEASAAAIKADLDIVAAAVLTDDTPFTQASTKVAMIGAIADDIASDLVDEGDAGGLRMSLNRNLYTQLRDGAGNERSLQIDEVGMMQGQRDLRRYAESQYLLQQAMVFATMFVDEKASAPNYGFELR